MAGERPSPFITVPHGFHYHYNDQAPKTPERELSSDSFVERPPSARGFRVKRRSRPRINTSITSMTSDVMVGLQDTPLPSIEISEQKDNEPELPVDPGHQESFLPPFQSRALTVPRTPSGQRTTIGYNWGASQQTAYGQSIARPTSPSSSLSDSSDDSLMDSEDGFSFGGSCTSPESDAPDPFTFTSPTKIPKEVTELPMGMAPTIKAGPSAKPRWTKEMDHHIWTVYMSYLNDPTVTPFKTLPGIPPPAGVCHRIAREAKRSWKGGKNVYSPPSIIRVKQLHRDGSPDTVTERSGSATPTGQAANQKFLPWPGSGSATRKRFRELCKRKATIAPYYQRMLHSRSPSPFFTHPPSALRSTRAGSPLNTQASFATRDVAISLSASTASSMQPNAPLARLSMQQGDDWFNDPEVPWASPPAIPSDIDNGHEGAGDVAMSLGSPFTGSHTWGPSNSRRRERPSLNQVQSEDTSTIPRLRSPVHFASVPRGSILEGFTSKTPKRPAQNELDDLNGGAIHSQGDRLEDLFGSSVQSARRRLRARGMSLEDRFAPTGTHNVIDVENRPDVASANPSTYSPRPSSSPMSLDHDIFVSSPRDGSIKRLGSPFAGISGRPPRARVRHISSHSLSSYNPDELESIDQRLNQASTMGPF